MKYKSRNKAFVGTALTLASLALSAGSKIYKGIKQRKLAKQQQAQEQTDANIANINAEQNNLTENLNGQDYLNNYYDRVQLIPQFKCGGRKKANFGSILDAIGAFAKTDAGKQAINSAITVGGNALADVAQTSLASVDTSINKGTAFNLTKKDSIKSRSYENQTPYNQYNPYLYGMQFEDRFPTAKYGKKIKCSC